MAQEQIHVSLKLDRTCLEDGRDQRVSARSAPAPEESHLDAPRKPESK